MNPDAYDLVALRPTVRMACPTAILGLGVLLAAVTTAGAQGYQGTQDAQAACTPDVFRLCSQFIPNRDPIVACLVRSRALLSPECRVVFAEPARVVKVGKRTTKSRKVRRAKRARSP
jgi:hypothetical protein